MITEAFRWLLREVQGPTKVAQVDLRDEYEVARSEFPHPLVTIDYDPDDKLVSVSVVGGDLRVREYRR